jgi:hypothetical protein
VCRCSGFDNGRDVTRGLHWDRGRLELGVISLGLWIGHLGSRPIGGTHVACSRAWLGRDRCAKFEKILKNGQAVKSQEVTGERRGIVEFDLGRRNMILGRDSKTREEERSPGLKSEVILHKASDYVWQPTLLDVFQHVYNEEGLTYSSKTSS